jgi:hypothetical protein
MEVPDLESLEGLPVDVEHGDEPWITRIAARSADGDEVVVTWDAVAAAAHVRWDVHGARRIVIEREAVVKVAVSGSPSEVWFQVWLRSGDLQGQLSVRVGAAVTVSDALLRV